MHRLSLALALLVVVSVGIVGGGCGDSASDNMSIQCGPNGTCPTGYSCNAASSVCVRTQPDAATSSPLPDAPTSSPLPDAPAGMVTVIVIDRGERVAGAPVVFSAPDGTLLATATTDAEGTVTHTLPANGMVTAVYEADHQLNTVAGVQPGETIRIVANTNAQVPSDVQVGYLTIAPLGAATGATIYEIDLENRNGSVGGIVVNMSDPTTIGILRSQVEDGMVHLRAVAGHTTWTDWSAVEVPFPGGNTTATLPAWQPIESSAVTFTDVPSWIDLYHIDNGLDSKTLQSTDASATLALVPEPPYLLSLSSQKNDSTGCGNAFSLRALSVKPTTLTVDVGQTLLPMLGNLDLGSFMGPGASLSWDMAAGVDGAVGGEVTASWQKTVDQNLFGYQWTLETPPGTEADLPILPSAYDSWLPPGDSGLQVHLRFFGPGTWASYADYKAGYFQIYGIAPTPPWQEVDFVSGGCD